MLKLLFIGLKENLALPLEQFLLKKGYQVFMADNAAEAQSHWQQEELHGILLDPFSDFSIGSYCLLHLKNNGLLPSTILACPGNNPSETEKAATLVNKSYFSYQDNFNAIENKIAECIQKKGDQPFSQRYVHKPIAQYIQAEIEKAKRGKASLSFLYFKIDKTLLPNDREKLLQKIIVAANYRLRISDDVLLFEEGCLLLLFGTSPDMRGLVTENMHKRIRRTTKNITANALDHIFATEATFPEDGHSWEKLLGILNGDQLESLTKMLKISEQSQNLEDYLKGQWPFNQIFKKPTNTPQHENSLLKWLSKLPTNPNVLKQLKVQLALEDTSPQSIENFLYRETKHHQRIIQIMQGLMMQFPLCYHHESKQFNHISLADALLSFTTEDLLLISTYTLLDEYVFLNQSYDLNLLRETALTTTSIALELANILHYEKPAEVLLTAFASSLGYVAIKVHQPDKFNTFKSWLKQFDKPAAEIALEFCPHTPSELSQKYLETWGAPPKICEALASCRYEIMPTVSSQLSAIIHLAMHIAYFTTGLSLEGKPQLAEIALDEIKLKHKQFDTNRLLYLHENYEETQQKFAFLYS